MLHLSATNKYHHVVLLSVQQIAQQRMSGHLAEDIGPSCWQTGVVMHPINSLTVRCEWIGSGVSASVPMATAGTDGNSYHLAYHRFRQQIVVYLHLFHNPEHRLRDCRLSASFQDIRFEATVVEMMYVARAG